MKPIPPLPEIIPAINLVIYANPVAHCSAFQEGIKSPRLLMAVVKPHRGRSQATKVLNTASQNSRIFSNWLLQGPASSQVITFFFSFGKLETCHAHRSACHLHFRCHGPLPRPARADSCSSFPYMVGFPCRCTVRLTAGRFLEGQSHPTRSGESDSSS